MLYTGDNINMVEDTSPKIVEGTETKVAGQVGGFSKPYHRNKWWGYEKTFINDQYCAKMLHFEPRGYTSLHFHVRKHETLVVVFGTLTLEITLDKQKQVYTLKAGDAWVMIPGVPHKLIAGTEGCTIIEASTYDSDDDSIRITS